ncbi:MAG TPA: hypothetical protein VKS23_03250 [Thermoanaerobaculia bacterium]|nr:hypothetical protein [Thermoanaerobaculia bacterium]
MTRFARHLAVVLAALGAGCGSPDTNPAPSPSAPLSRAAEPRDVYRPPADGRVTAAQVEMFLSVLDRVRLDLRGVKPTPVGDPLSTVPADVAAARARNMNVEEFLWVKERVLEAEAAAMTARLNAAALTMLEKTLADLKARRADAADEGSRKLLAEQTAQFEAEAERVRKESKVRESDAVRSNMKTLEPYRSRLAASQDALEKPLLKEAEKSAPGPASRKP